MKFYEIEYIKDGKRQKMSLKANSKTYIDPSVNELGARVRIAKKANEIESPTGMAFSGEVEDFKTQIVRTFFGCMR